MFKTFSPLWEFPETQHCFLSVYPVPGMTKNYLQNYCHNIVSKKKKDPLKEVVLIVAETSLIFFWVVGKILSLRIKWIFIGSSYIYYLFVFYSRQMALKLALSMLLLTPHMQAIREDSRPGEAAVESVFTVSLPKWSLLTISFTLSCSTETWNYSKWLYVTEDFNLSNSCITLNKWLTFT